MAGEGATTQLAELWEATDRLLERATLAGILAHKLGPLAAHRLRRLGEPLPEPLRLEERAASLTMLSAIPLIERVRENCDEQLVLIKGPEVARVYPQAARRFWDIDLLTDDATAVQRALVARGFLEVDDPDFDFTPRHHHLQPLKWPTIGLIVEVHAAPYWANRAAAPPLGEILDARVPSALGIEGVFAPTPLHHALILTSHAWRHEPLQTLRDLIDIAAVSAGVDERELTRTATAWGIGRVWNTTRRAIDGIFYGGPQTVPLRTWARHLELVRDRTVIERHVEHVVHGFWGLPPHQATAHTARALRYLIERAPGETWRDKLTRVRRAVRNARGPVSRRDR
jgi:Uncharacterised nucleotidyltransferase